MILEGWDEVVLSACHSSCDVDVGDFGGRLECVHLLLTVFLEIPCKDKVLHRFCLSVQELNDI